MRPWSLPAIPVLPDLRAAPAAAFEQDGVFTRSQARRDGWSDHAQRRLLRAGTWVSIAGNVLRHADVEVGPWQLARAVHLMDGLVVSHATAGLVWQLLVPTELHSIGKLDRQPAPLQGHRLPLRASELVHLRGMRVTSPERTLADLLCSLDEQPGVEMLADGYRRGLAPRRARVRRDPGDVG
jgi:hypothetical protein